MLADYTTECPTEFRVVLLEPNTGQLLVQSSRCATYRLPRISVVLSAGVAQVIPDEMQRMWSIQTVPLEVLLREDRSAFAIVELRSPMWNFDSAGFASVRLDEIDVLEIDEEARKRVNQIVSGDTRGRSPFSRLGWIHDVQAWIKDSETVKVLFSDDVRSYSPISTFTLARLGTSCDRAYWLKVPRSQSRTELAVTETLSRYCPGFLPRLVAIREDWNAWITEEFGQPIHQAPNLTSYEKATRCLAGLQIASINHINKLLAIGCCDQRISTLRTSLFPLTGYLQDSLDAISSHKAVYPQASHLSKAIALVEEACLALEEIGICDAIIHNDLNSGNILIDDERAVLIDWAEACIGIPLASFHHLLVQAQDNGLSPADCQQLTTIYKQYWVPYLPETALEYALALIPPVAIASYVAGRDLHFTSPERHAPVVQGFAGVLAGRLIEAVQATEFQAALVSYRSTVSLTLA